PPRPPVPDAPEPDSRQLREGTPPERDTPRVRRADRRRVPGERSIGAERELVRVLLHRASYFEQVVERIGAESFRDGEMRSIFAAMVELGPDAGPEALSERLEPGPVEAMQELLDEPGGLEHADEAITGSLAAMHERELA